MNRRLQLLGLVLIAVLSFGTDPQIARADAGDSGAPECVRVGGRENCFVCEVGIDDCYMILCNDGFWFGCR